MKFPIKKLIQDKPIYRISKKLLKVYEDKK